MKPAARDLARLRRGDARLARAMDVLPRFPGFPDREVRKYRSHFEYLARAIVYQQLHGKAAATIHRRICELTPGPRFPTPAELERLSDARLTGAGLSRGKLAALRDLAERVQDGRLATAALARRPDEEVVERLIEVRGIGVWTAQMFLLFRLGRLDVLADGDLGVREGLRLLDGLEERPSPRDVALRGEAWRPLRSVATWMLWRVVEHHRREASERARDGAAR